MSIHLDDIFAAESESLEPDSLKVMYRPKRDSVLDHFIKIEHNPDELAGCSNSDLRVSTTPCPTVLAYLIDFIGTPSASYDDAPASVEEPMREKIRLYAERRNFQIREDEAGNIAIFVPGKGKGIHSKPVALQAHMDIVPDVALDETFDFVNQSIETEMRFESHELTRGEEVLALGSKNRKTSVGIDNKVGDAMLCAIPDELDNHPPLYLLFTSREEIGLIGAQQFNIPLNDTSFEGAEPPAYLINLDSENENELMVGCAAGTRATYTWNIHRRNPRENEIPVSVSISGLNGGHSGVVIQESTRGNAIQLLAAYINNAASYCEAGTCTLASIHSNDRDNKIPKEAHATLWIDKSQYEKFCSALNKAKDDKWKIRELKFDNDGFKLKIEQPKELPLNPISGKPNTSSELLNMLIKTIHGVDEFRKDDPSLPHRSNNLARVWTDENSLSTIISYRSQSNGDLPDFVSRVESNMRLAPSSRKAGASYRAWEAVQEGRLYNIFSDTMTSVLGQTPKREITHGGLETGELLGRIPGIKETVSIGPNIWEPHSHNEAASIESIERIYRILCQAMEKLCE